MLLSDCPIDAKCEIVAINLSGDEKIRLCELGLKKGSKLRVCQMCPFGSLLISRGTERIGLSPYIAKSLEVKYA
ncbi:MAG: ferrous iron transport protein A [Bifidobacteriaceae bacterium]|jgi:ferrous iron transport protein A|nr:ferrous iron transport protein A [Bifidobacteriaceae bacterium]